MHSRPAAARIELIAPAGLPEVAAGDDLAVLIVKALDAEGLALQDDDVLVVAQKIVSKAEGRGVDLRTIEPGARALELAPQCAKDPRLVEMILSQSTEVLRVMPGALIVVHRHGWVMANAGVDQSNLPGNEGDDAALLLPEDPDRSAARLRESLLESLGLRVGVIVNDSFGRPWRQGVVGTALGVAGWPSLIDARGTQDRHGRILRGTLIAHADELAAAASLLQGQAGEGRPVVIVRGLRPGSANGSGRDLMRPPSQDLFR